MLWLPENGEDPYGLKICGSNPQTLKDGILRGLSSFGI
jgi:hypothetical protein